MDTNTLTIEGLRSLHDKQDKSCVSIYMQTHRAGADTKQDPIRFKNLLNQTRQKLLLQGSADADQLLKPLRKLENDVEFWRHQRDALALFASKDFFQYFRLPIEVPELILVADRFHTRPLIPLFFADQRFFVLTLGLKSVQLFEGNSFSLDEVVVPGLPESFKETLAGLEIADDLQGHSNGPGSVSSQAIFHGHDPSDLDKIRIEKHLRNIGSAIDGALKDQKAPLLLYGVEYLVSMYKTVNSYSNLLQESLTGSSDRIVISDLYRDAKSIVEPYLKKSTVSLVAQYKEQLGTGLASSSNEKILPAAKHGRLEALLVNDSGQLWGAFDVESNQVRIDQLQNDGNEDLVNLAAAECILNGGTVVHASNTDLANASMGAIFRY